MRVTIQIMPNEAVFWFECIVEATHAKRVWFDCLFVTKELALQRHRWRFV